MKKRERVNSTKFGIAANLVLILLGLLIGLLLCEAAARFLVPVEHRPLTINQYNESERGKFCQYNELLGWAGRPDVAGEFTAPDARCQVTQNRFGFRGATYGLSRAETRRMIVLGDSFAWGYGVDDQQIFTSLIGKNATPHLEVINLGVSGFGNDQEFLLWNSLGRRWQPDEALLLVTVYTDFWDNMYDSRYDYPKPLFRFQNNRMVLTNVPVPQKKGPWSNPAMQNKNKRSFFTTWAADSALCNLIAANLARFPSIRQYMENSKVILPRRAGYEWEYTIYEPFEYRISENVLKEIEEQGFDRRTIDKLKLLSGPQYRGDSSFKTVLEQALGSELSPGLWEYMQLNALTDQEQRFKFLAWETMFGLLEIMKKDMDAAGVRLTVAVVPSVIQVYPEMWSAFLKQNQSSNPKRLECDQPNRLIKEACARINLPVIDLLPGLRKAGQRDPYLYFPYNRHWTISGHRVVHDILLSEMKLR